MNTQKAICVKMDTATLEDLNEECNKFGKKRNRCINIAVQQWVERQDKERQDTYWRSVGGSSYDEKALELGKYILCNLTDKENFQVRFIANAAGAEKEKVLLLLIRRGLEDFCEHQGKEETTMRTKNESKWVFRKPRNAEYKHLTQNGQRVYKDEKYCYVEYVSEWDGKKIYYRFRRTT